MKAWRNPGLWITLAAVILVGIFPIITGNAATREVLFTVLLSVVLATSLKTCLVYTVTRNSGHGDLLGWGATAGCD